MTNSLSFLPQTDHIIMLDNGSIVESGSYNQLIDKDGPFKEFIKAFRTTTESETHIAEGFKNSYSEILKSFL